MKMSPRLLTVLLLLLLLPAACLCARHARGNMRFTGRNFPPPPCCTKVSATNISADVIGETYHEQPANPPCLRAVILTTKHGKACIDPNAHWLTNFTANLKKV